MIEVRFKAFRTGDFKFSCKGHAGAGVKGTDVVCAAASALAYGFAENLKLSEAMLESGYMKEDDGVMKLQFKPKPEFINSLYLLFTAKRNEFLLLQKGNEDYIKVW